MVDTTPTAPRTTTRDEKRTVTTRPVRLPFDASIPKRWLADSSTATQLSNGVNLLFPFGERFFVRSVKHYLEQLKAQGDDELVAQIRGFFGQEGRHAREHERFFEILRGQGYELDEFLTRFEASFTRLEKLFPAEYHLAATAAGEHFTALMAANAFRDRPFLEQAHPIMSDLMLWHAAEEIEHKAVAFDVLTRVVPNPIKRYFVRMSGMAVAATFLAYWWMEATRMLAAQDGTTWEEFRADGERVQQLRRELGIGERRIGRDVFLRGILSYLRPGFHPWDDDDGHLAEEFLKDFEARRLARREEEVA
ncbi:MAG: metal-dependent hydrolase [Sandaracinus sp.]|nr:metal-dependent hydrolase [Sandaracinus sp.]MCB9632601.1 metal-dependent hydrolase [Sandaracinus sp.]